MSPLWGRHRQRCPSAQQAASLKFVTKVGLLDVVLVLVDLSIVFAALSLRLRGVSGIGSLLAEIIGARETISDHEATQTLLDRLGQNFEINKRILGRKVTLLTWAYTFTLLAILTDGVGKLI